jgi:hypothetical protein
MHCIRCRVSLSLFVLVQQVFNVDPEFGEELLVSVGIHLFGQHQLSLPGGTDIAVLLQSINDFLFLQQHSHPSLYAELVRLGDGVRNAAFHY